MKFFFNLFLFLICNVVIAQKKETIFVKQYDYRLNSEVGINSDYKGLKLNLYADSSNLVGLLDVYSQYLKSDFTIFKKGKLLKIKQSDLETTEIFVSQEHHLFYRLKDYDTLMNSKVTFEPLNIKGTFLDFSCEYYKLKSDAFEEKNVFTNDSCFCIDIQNKDKNVKLIFPNSNIDGLILAYSFVDSFENMLILKEIKNVDLKTNFDFDSEYIKYQKTFDTYLKEITNQENDDFEKIP